MLTEDGSIKTAEIAVSPALELYRKKLKIIALVLLIVGAIGLIAYIVLSTVFDTDEGQKLHWTDAFLVFAVPFALGLIGSITFARLKSRESAEGRTSECVFYADCFFYSSKMAHKIEKTEEKFSYPDAAIKCENENYFYLEIKGKGIILPLGKENLSVEEQNTIRKCFRPATDGKTVELKNYKPEEV